MAWTITDRDEVMRVLASGQLLVRFSDGREIRYQTTVQLLELLTAMNGYLDTVSATPGDPSVWPSRRRLARFSSGLNSSDSLS